MAELVYSQFNLNSIPLLGLVLEPLATAPGSPVQGRAYYDTALGYGRIWSGSAWENINNVPGIGVIIDSMVSASAAIAESKLSLASDAAAGTASRRTLGTGATQAFPGNGTISQLGAATADLSLNSHKITNLTDPGSAQDAATKQYVDNARAGITGIKDPVRVAAASNVTVSGPGTTIDSITMATNDRVLLTTQTTTTQNGIYVFNGSGSAMTRATDANATGEVLDGTIVAVAEGTSAGNQYIQTATPSGAPGAWSQTWQVYSTGGQTYSAGTGLTLTSNTFSITAPIPLSLGGTNATTASAARTSLGVPGKYAATISSAMTAGTGLDITHSLGTQDIVVSVRDATTNVMVQLAWTAKDTNTVTVTADVAVSANALKIVVIG